MAGEQPEIQLDGAVGNGAQERAKQDLQNVDEGAEQCAEAQEDQQGTLQPSAHPGEQGGVGEGVNGAQERAKQEKTSTSSRRIKEEGGTTETGVSQNSESIFGTLQNLSSFFYSESSIWNWAI